MLRSALPLRLLAALLLLTQPTFLHAISDAAQRVETTFLFILSSHPRDQFPNECPDSIRHTLIDLYNGINPNDPTEDFEGIVWKDLAIDGVTCLDSIEREAATYFIQPSPSPPDTTADKAVPWFLVATDNSARRCGPFTPKYPARYYFTDDMPRFKQRFIDTKIIPRGQELPDAVENPIRGDIFMISQQFAPISGGVRSPIVCMYRAATPAPTPEPTPLPDDGGSVCFPAHATVLDERNRPIPMHRLRLGDRVQVTSSGLFSPVVSFSHRDELVFSVVTVLLISNSASQGRSNVSTFSASPSHLVRIPGGSLLPVAMLQQGDKVILSGGSTGRIERVSNDLAKGLYSPVTQHGDIVVNSVVASCYTTSLRAEAAHALLSPVRALFAMASKVNMLGPEWCGVIDTLRWVFR